MKYFLFVFIAVIVFQSCTSELNEIDGVIGDNIVSDILNDGKKDNNISIPSESFLSQYFSSDDEFPISTRIENKIRHDFNSPVNPNKDPKELSAKWTGNFYFETGEYTFSIKSNKGIKVILDNKIILNDPDNQKVTTYKLNQQMDGVHRLTVEYNLEEPIIEINNDTPTDEIKNEAPVVEVNNDTPTTEVNNDAPVIEVNNDNPIAEVNNDAPVVEVNNDAPTVEVDWEPSNEETVNEQMKFIPMGWAASTKGGSGGKIIKVTNLNKDGKGSFREAIDANEPRIIVFEVGGVIDLEGSRIKIKYPFLTIMGQTAPAPGITFIKGGFNIYTNDIIMQHIRIRPGENNQAKKSGWEIDGLSVISTFNIIIDHCSFSWGTDENLSASGPRFQGNNVSEWRKNTSRTITFSNNIIAECLDNSTHSSGKHSMGTLVHDNVTEVALIGNIYVSNADRNPLFKGGTSGVIVNNYIYNARNFVIQYKLSSAEWAGRDIVTGKMSIVGNVLEKGTDSRPDLPFAYFTGGPVEVYWDDNLVLGDPVKEERLLLGDPTLVNKAPVWPEIIEVRPADQLKEYLLENSGARPWDRDEVDKRIVIEIKEGKSRIIDSEQDKEGYPSSQPTYKEFDPSIWGL